MTLQKAGFGTTKVVPSHDQVAFVFDYDGGAPGDLLEQFGIFTSAGFGGINYDQHQVGVGESFVGFADADAFGFVEGPADAGSIHEFHRNSTDGNGFAYEVPRGTGGCGNNGALPFDKTIKEAGFADVGA